MLARFFLDMAAKELNVEPKRLRPDVETYLSDLPWPGNVRQLENACRWLTVMAPGKEIRADDLPRELRALSPEEPMDDGWEGELKSWAERRLAAGKKGLLVEAVPRFERILIDVALARTGGRRQEAAKLLGWGRNTLTRKLKELGVGDE